MPRKKEEVFEPQTDINLEVNKANTAGDAADSGELSQTDTKNSSEISIVDDSAHPEEKIFHTDIENDNNNPQGHEDGVEFSELGETHQTDLDNEQDDNPSGEYHDGNESNAQEHQTEVVKVKRTRRRSAGNPVDINTDIQNAKEAADGVEPNSGSGDIRKNPSQSGRNVPVVSIDEERTVETEADKKRNDLLDLVESQKSGKILSGTIQGIETSEDNQNHSFAVIYHGNYKVIIPVSEGVDPPEDYRGLEPDTVLRYMMTKRLGAEVDYIIKGIDTKNNIAIASRTDAMKAKRKQYYFGTDRDGNNLIYSGICAEARVVSVIRSGLFADIFGLEVYIPLRELSYQRWMDASAHFQPGQRILVKILEVDRKSRTEVSVKVSVKQAAENPYEKALKRYVVGNQYVGTVSMVDTNGVFVALDGGIDCLCSYPKRGRPPRGARVTVRIMGINYKSNRIWGAISHIAIPR